MSENKETRRDRTLEFHAIHARVMEGRSNIVCHTLGVIFSNIIIS